MHSSTFLNTLFLTLPLMGVALDFDLLDLARRDDEGPAVNETLFDSCMQNFDCTLTTNRINVCYTTIPPDNDLNVNLFRQCVCDNGQIDKPVPWLRSFTNCTNCLSLAGPAGDTSPVGAMLQFCNGTRPNAAQILVAADIMLSAQKEAQITTLIISDQNAPITLPFAMGSDDSKMWMSGITVFLASIESAKRANASLGILTMSETGLRGSISLKTAGPEMTEMPHNGMIPGSRVTSFDTAQPATISSTATQTVSTSSESTSSQTTAFITATPVKKSQADKGLDLVLGPGLMVVATLMFAMGAHALYRLAAELLAQQCDE